MRITQGDRLNKMTEAVERLKRTHDPHELEVWTYRLIFIVEDFRLEAGLEPLVEE